MTARCLAAYCGSLIVGALAVAPSAGAEPPFPDLTRYTPVNTADYAIPPSPGGAYPGAQSGVVFNTPTGQACNMWINIRGMWAFANCFGPLPGVGHTGVTASTTEAGRFIDSESTAGNHRVVPAGSKIEFTRQGWSATCAVDEAMTACVVDFDPPGDVPARHGFVLGPQESWTF